MKDIISKIRTVEERDRLNSELDLMLSGLYESKGSGLNSVLKNRVRSWVSNLISDNMPADIEECEGYLQSIKTSLLKLKVLKLKIAFEPTDSSIDKFIAYARKNLSGDVILEFEVDPKVFGGAEITYNGKYKDFSLKRLFDEEYKEKEDELKKVLLKKYE